MDRRAFLAGTGAAGLAALAGCLGAASGGGRTTTDSYDIGMSTSKFKPQEYTVAVGETVVWQNTSSHSHTVTAYESAIPEDATFFASGDFESTEAAREGWMNGGGAIEPGDVYQHTFEVAGTHNYFCVPHEKSGMVGQIVVEE
jgi:plastocyanin